MSEKNFFSDFHFTYTIFSRLNARGVYLKSNFLEGIYSRGAFNRIGVHLQIRTVVDIAFFFDTRQAIEKTTNLHYNLFIGFILDHIHFFIEILFIRGRNEWIYGITFDNKNNS